VRGLTSAQAAQRLTECGPNEPVSVRRLSTLVQLLHLIANPLVLILIVASAISAALGQRADAAIILIIVLIGIVTNFWQTYRSQQAADRLRASANTRVLGVMGRVGLESGADAGGAFDRGSLQSPIADANRCGTGRVDGDRGSRVEVHSSRYPISREVSEVG